MKITISKFGGTCPKCGQHYAAGTEIMFHKTSWGHVDCSKQQASASTQMSGAVSMNEGFGFPNTVKGSDGVSRTEFGSVTEMMEAAFAFGAGRCVVGARRADEWIRESSGTRFFNNYTPETLMAAFEKMPEKLMSAVSDVKNKIERFIDPPIQMRRKLRRNLEEGTDLDPMAVLHRRVDGWEEVKRERVNKPVIRIAVNVVMPGCAAATELIYRGAAAVAMADILTSRGHSVEIVGFWATKETCSALRSKLHPAS